MLANVKCRVIVRLTGETEEARSADGEDSGVEMALVAVAASTGSADVSEGEAGASEEPAGVSSA